MTGATLHAIPLAALVRDYLAKTIGREVPGVPSIPGTASASGSFSATAVGTVTLVDVANVYVQALKLGGPPQKTVAEHFRWSRSIASKKVMECRAAGLLGTTTRGKAAP